MFLNACGGSSLVPIVSVVYGLPVHCGVGVSGSTCNW